VEKIKHGIKTLAACGGIRGVDDTSSFYSNVQPAYFRFDVKNFIVHSSEN
jgi:hypothetical protein